MSAFENNTENDDIDHQKFDNINHGNLCIPHKTFKDTKKITSCYEILIQHTSLVLVTDSIISAYSIS